MISKCEENVAVLLCCYKGKRFIEEQIYSIINQTHKNISLWVSIDGEDDGSEDLIKKATQDWKREQVHILRGPGKGFAANFLSLLCNKDIEADFYAFSDQDDIWEKEKISRALENLRSVSQSVPAVYATRSLLVDEFGQNLGESKILTKAPSFENALVQSISSGNTMVINKKSKNLIMKHCSNKDIISHDWLVYLVVSSVGGKVIYDPYMGLKYRQHGTNLVGENVTFFSRFRRLKLLMNGTFRTWNNTNINVLENIRHIMTEESKKSFDCFKKARNSSLFPRIFGFLKSGIYRQTFSENVFLFIACLLKRI
jgi:glycosyltransferase involved in cell wall biosynthesis